MRPFFILLACGLLLAAAPATPAMAAEGDSLFRQLQDKGRPPDGPKRRTGTPTTRFVDNMRQKGIEPIPDAARRARPAEPQGPAAARPRGIPQGPLQSGPRNTPQGTPQDAAQASLKSPPRGEAQNAALTEGSPDQAGGAAVNALPKAQGEPRPADPAGTFTGRVKTDGRGGFRTFDATGRHTKTLAPDGRGGYRVYDASGRYQGRVNVK
jgi:hypothetical protein